MDNKQIIGNIAMVDVDGLRGVNHYVVKQAYNLVHDDGFATYHEDLIDEFDYTWKEIDRDGGLAVINKEIEEVYNAELIS